MRTVKQAFLCSLCIHIVYVFSIYGWPNMKMGFEKIKRGGEYIAESHTDVMFIFIGSPVIILGTSFLGIAIVSGFIILLLKKLRLVRFKRLN